MEEIKDVEGNCSGLDTSECLPTNAESPTSPGIDEKIEANHNQGTVITDSQIPIPQNVPDGPSLDQDMPITSDSSNESEPRFMDVAVVSSEVQSIPTPHSPDKSKEVWNELPHQFEDGFRVDDAQVNGDYTSSSESRHTEVRPHVVLLNDLGHHQVEVGSIQNKTAESTDPSEHIKQANVNRGLVDTAAPFESVREAVTKFGGIVDWKAHKALTLERRKHVQLELEKVQEEIPEYQKQSEAAEDAKVQVLKELGSTKRLVEELKLNLERAQTEEAQAKQDSELAQLRVKEVEEGIADEASVAAKAQVEVAKARHEAAVAELRSVKEELEELQGEYVSLVNERDMAIRNAEETVSASKEIEKMVEELTLEVITVQESLELAHAAHLEAEEHRIGAALAREQDTLNWEKELKQAEGELQQLNEQILLAKDLKSKLDTASTLLLNLKSELAAYMEAKLNQQSESIEEEGLKDEAEETKKTQTSMQAALASSKKELEEVKINIEKAKEEVKCLRVAASSLKAELDTEKAALTTMKQREGMASIAVSSLEAELNRTRTELELVLTKEKEARESMVELPKALQQAARDADEAKSVAQLAREELRKAKEEEEQAKAGASTMEIRLNATLKEIEAAKASERLALAAVKALEESEQASGMGNEDSPSGVTLPLEEYYMLSKRAHEAEELANERVTAAITQIEVAKESELRSLERLDAAHWEMEERKEALRVAMEKSEKAKEGKLGVEQELRKWRAEHEQRRRANDAAHAAANPSRSPPRSFEGRRETKSFDKDHEAAVPVHSMLNQKSYVSVSDTEDVMPESKVRKKKPFFPRIVMFLARKKSQALK